MHIQQQFDPIFTKKFLRHQRVGKFLHGHSRLRRIINRIGRMFISIDEDVTRYDIKVKFDSTRKKGDVREHGYTDKYGDIGAALAYARGIAASDFGEGQLGESYVLYKEQIKTLSELIEKYSPSTMFNFGICYAYVDSILAKRFERVDFIGSDLSPYIAPFNAVEFSNIPNLKIIIGDIFPHFATTNYGRGVFFHSRTLTFLPKEFIERLYRAVYAAGFEYIVGFEQNGLNEETFRPYTFDLSDKESVYWRHRLYIHNYLGIAEKCGFHVRSADLFATGHTSPDLRVLRFIAERSKKL